MAIKKTDIENSIYLKRKIGQRKHLLNVPQPTASEKNTLYNIVDELMGYIAAKHS